MYVCVCLSFVSFFGRSERAPQHVTVLTLQPIRRRYCFRQLEVAFTDIKVKEANIILELGSDWHVSLR